MVRLALRAPPVLAVAVTVTNPLPEPLVGLMETHPAGKVVVQVQDGALAVTEMVAGPPGAA
jgi:hypothetical protein